MVAQLDTLKLIYVQEIPPLPVQFFGRKYRLCLNCTEIKLGQSSYNAAHKFSLGLHYLLYILNFKVLNLLTYIIEIIKYHWMVSDVLKSLTKNIFYPLFMDKCFPPSPFPLTHVPIFFLQLYCKIYLLSTLVDPLPLPPLSTF